MASAKNQQVVAASAAVAGTVMGFGVTSFAQPVVDRDGQVYTDKGVATGWWYLEWPTRISPRSLSRAMQMVEGTLRGILPSPNLVLTTRNGGYILQVQAESLETEINIGEEIAILVVMSQSNPNYQNQWQADFTKRLQTALAEANNRG